MFAADEIHRHAGRKVGNVKYTQKGSDLQLRRSSINQGPPVDIVPPQQSALFLLLLLLLLRHYSPSVMDGSSVYRNYP